MGIHSKPVKKYETRFINQLFIYIEYLNTFAVEVKIVFTPAHLLRYHPIQNDPSVFTQGVSISQ